MSASPSLRLQAGALVRKHRESAGMTVRELSQAAGLPENGGALSRLEKHGKGATLDNLAAIASALGITLRELVP